MQSRKHYKIGVSAEIEKKKKNKNDTFSWKKVFFSTWLKKCFLLTVFLKSCALLKTLSLMFQQHAAVAIKQMHVEKQKIYETLRVVLNMAKGKRVFFVFVFSGFLMVLWFVFVCLVKLQKC